MWQETCDASPLLLRQLVRPAHDFANCVPIPHPTMLCHLILGSSPCTLRDRVAINSALMRRYEESGIVAPRSFRGRSIRSACEEWILKISAKETRYDSI
jgi:hypothetical protein